MRFEENKKVYVASHGHTVCCARGLAEENLRLFLACAQTVAMHSASHSLCNPSPRLLQPLGESSETKKNVESVNKIEPRGFGIQRCCLILKIRPNSYYDH
jgi:hypothetical protein